MKNDIPAAAFRLLVSLPVRTHERAERRRSGPQNRGYIARTADKRGTAGINCPVRVGERTFKSITQAKELLRVSPQTLYAMLDDGRAVYV